MSFLDKLNAKPVNSAAGADAQKKPVNPFLGKTINPFAEMLKKQQEKKKEEEAPEAKAEEPAAEEKKSAPAKEEVKPEPAPVIKDEPESKKEEKKLDEPEKKQEEVKEKAPSEPKPAEEKKEEEPKVETEEKMEEEKPKKKTRKRAVRKTKKAAVAEEKEETESEEDEETSSEPMKYSMDEVMDMLSSNKTFDEASDILMGSLDDDDWITLRDNLAKRIQDVHIDSDLNPGAIKVFIDELDALYTEVKLYLIKTTASLDRITNKQTGVASVIEAKTIAGMKGRPSPAQKENAVREALSDVVIEGMHLNLLALWATGQARKTVLSGFMDIIKSKKDTLITASSMLKIENTAVNPPRI